MAAAKPRQGGVRAHEPFEATREGRAQGSAEKGTDLPLRRDDGVERVARNDERLEVKVVRLRANDGNEKAETTRVSSGMHARIQESKDRRFEANAADTSNSDGIHHTERHRAQRTASGESASGAEETNKNANLWVGREGEGAVLALDHVPDGREARAHRQDHLCNDSQQNTQRQPTEHTKR